MKIKVRDIMSKSVVSIESDKSVSDALSRMKSASKKKIVILSPEGRVEGITEKWKLERAEREKSIDEERKKRFYIVTAPQFSSPDDEIEDIEKFFPTFPAVIVGDRDRPVGIVTMKDIYAARRKTLEEMK